MILGFTGHRPASLPGNYSDRTNRALLNTADFILAQCKPTKVVSGMALGWDMAVAECAVNRGIGLIAAVPFKSQPSRWSRSGQERYQRLLNQADQIEIISSGSYSIEAMQLRNQWIVDRSDWLMALWHQGKSGTKNCVDYALAINRPTFNCWATFGYFYYQHQLTEI
ncbi:DUF1273 family protein [Pleurocapsales cyanobacterium LEGE 10410]|nr:DUF1273 family protein [Pleurocapsales cyanobacterium LEGE 10410]